MDTNVCGLNKVSCFVLDSSLEGRTVVLKDSSDVTWGSQTISSLSCVFIIPSMPAPAKKTYRVSLMNEYGTLEEYGRDIELGFGDSINVGLFENDEVVKVGSVPVATSSRVGGFKNYDSTSNGVKVNSSGLLALSTASSSQKGGVKVNNATSNGVYMDGMYLQTKVASSSQVGCVKVGSTGISVNSSTGEINLKTADSSNLGGIKIGNGLQISSGTASVKANEGITVSSSGVSVAAAGTTSSTKGGVYVESGSGIKRNSDGKIYIKVERDYVEIDEAVTVPANGYKSGHVFLYSSDNPTAFARLNHGFIEAVDFYSASSVDTFITRTSASDSVITLYYCAINYNNEAKTTTKLLIYYAYLDS